MPRGYRHIVIALAGLVLLAANHANAEGGNEKSSAEQYIATSLNHVAASNDKTPERAKRSAQEQQPCGPKQYGSSADLCAQWKAADAATDSAWWAWAGGVIGLGSLVGIFLALGLAFHSNWIARDAAKRQLRAYVTYSNEWWHGDFSPGQPLELKPRIVNLGETPARDVVWQAELRNFNATGAESEFTRSPMQAPSKSTIGKGQFLQTTLKVVPSLPVYARVMSGETILYVFGWVDYKDVFGTKQSMTFRLRFEPSDERWVMCPVGNSST